MFFLVPCQAFSCKKCRFAVRQRRYAKEWINQGGVSMAKQKVGLHKSVWQIFEGVVISKEPGSHEPAKTSLSNRLDFLRPTPRESTPAPVFRPSLPQLQSSDRKTQGSVEAAGQKEAKADTKNLPPSP
jgi:hypothetical protein